MATAKKIIKKAQGGRKLLTPARTRQVADSLDYEAYKKNTGGFAALMDKKIKNRQEVYDMSMKSADTDTKNASRYRKLADQAEVKSKAPKPKAKDGKWIQKAVNPKHKGYCTPMTKATCTPKRKALAKTLKAMGRARKAK